MYNFCSPQHIKSDVKNISICSKFLNFVHFKVILDVK